MIRIELEDLPDLQSRLARVRCMEAGIQRLPDHHYAPLGSTLTDVEWFSLCAIIKTSSNLHAFCSMIEARNIIAAGAMLRSQIDTAMRINGLAFLSDVEAAGKLLMNGGKFSDLRHKDNPKRKLVDRYLVEMLNEKYPWVLATYTGTCEDAHLTRQALARKLRSQGRMIFFNLQGVDHHLIAEETYFHLVDTFYIALKMTSEVLVEFLNTRPGPAARAAERAKTLDQPWS